MTPADQYRAIYKTLWRIDEAHDLRPHLSQWCGENNNRPFAGRTGAGEMEAPVPNPIKSAMSLPLGPREDQATPTASRGPQFQGEV